MSCHIGRPSLKISDMMRVDKKSMKSILVITCAPDKFILVLCAVFIILFTLAKNRIMLFGFFNQFHRQFHFKILSFYNIIDRITYRICR